VLHTPTDKKNIQTCSRFMFALRSTVLASYAPEAPLEEQEEEEEEGEPVIQFPIELGDKQEEQQQQQDMDSLTEVMSLHQVGSRV